MPDDQVCSCLWSAFHIHGVHFMPQESGWGFYESPQWGHPEEAAGGAGQPTPEFMAQFLPPATRPDSPPPPQVNPHFRCQSSR